MKTIIAFVLSCMSAFAAATNDIQIISTTTTNTYTPIVVTTTFDVFTRDGQTNLIRGSRAKNGSVQQRWQEFYYNGSRLGIYSTYANGSSTISLMGGTPYTLSFVFVSTNQMKFANIGSNSVLLDAFICTNGVFYPADTSLIHKAQGEINAMSVDMK